MSKCCQRAFIWSNVVLLGNFLVGTLLNSFFDPVKLATSNQQYANSHHSVAVEGSVPRGWQSSRCRKDAKIISVHMAIVNTLGNLCAAKLNLLCTGIYSAEAELLPHYLRVT